MHCHPFPVDISTFEHRDGLLGLRIRLHDHDRCRRRLRLVRSRSNSLAVLIWLYSVYHQAHESVRIH